LLVLSTFSSLLPLVSEQTVLAALDWTTNDIQIRSTRLPNAPPVSFQRIVNAERRALKGFRSNSDDVELSYTYRLLSFVDRYLSSDEERMCDCGGVHANVDRKFGTFRIDDRNGTTLTSIPLTELFGEDPILSALLKDKLVLTALSQSPATLAPTSIAGLASSLDGRVIQTGDCDYRFDASLIQRFTIYDFKDGLAAVRISLPYNTEACRGTIAQIGLWLPVPVRLLPGLKAAKSQSAGFLMVDLPRLARGRSTVME
jgi:hypothetical protein